MLARIRKSMDKDNTEKGFTLIELLVVMIIIGILAAIAIPVFLSQRAKARDTAVKADVSTLGKEVATYFVDGTGVPTITGGTRYTVNGTDAGKVSDGNVLVGTYGTIPATGPTTSTITNTTWTSAAWCIAVYNPNGSNKVYKYSAQNGLEQGNCTSAILP